MKAIMISIQPQWVEKILNGEKTIEIRKTMPKCELPCKVYIYCTKTKNKVGKNVVPPDYLTKPNYLTKRYVLGANYDECLNGKVVAEFTLNNIVGFYVFENGSVQGWNWFGLKRSCLTYEQISDYIGADKKGYAWHIDNLKIYDTPKELSEFYGAKECPYKDWGDIDNIGCWEYGCEMFSREECRFGHLKLDRPPQSWCYVEELEVEESQTR